MKHTLPLFITLLLLLSPALPAFSETDPKKPPAPAANQDKIVDQILSGVEKRYQGAGFSADFSQSSTLQAMQITDTAYGHALFKRPGMMRWEYQHPDKQEIITDGTTLWIYLPDDGQVTIGKFPSFFGEGKGAGFLSDISLIRKKFIVSLGESPSDDAHLLKLWPREKNPDFNVIQLTISKKTSDVIQIVTYNAYGDETKIQLSKFDYASEMDNALFEFKVPYGADVIHLEPKPEKK
jgi:outer membrane lipoprotein carrier protein